MRYRLNSRDYRSGGSNLYFGSVRRGYSDESICRSRVRFLQVQIAISEGEQKNAWLKEYEIKDPSLRELAKKHHINSRAYFDLKIKDLLKERKSSSSKTGKESFKTKKFKTSKTSGKRGFGARKSGVRTKTSKELLEINRKKFRRASFGGF